MKSKAPVINRLKRSHILRASVCIAFGMLLTESAMAQYHAIGPIYAEDCFDLGVKVCSKKTVTEVRRDGQRYEIGRIYPTVSSYSNGRCSIDTKSRGLGPLSWGANAVLQPDFWGYDKDGKYGKIDADRIFFECVKK